MRKPSLKANAKKYIGYAAVLVVLLFQGGSITDLVGKALLDVSTRMGVAS